MSLIKWDPWKEFESAQRNFRRLLQTMDDDAGNGYALELSTFNPRMDFSEDNDNLYIMAELPGVSKENVKVSVKDNVLTIRGEKKRKEEQKDHNYYKLERSFGEFVRQFTLPEGIKEKDIQATFEDGVLEVTIPHAKTAKTDELNIPIGSSKATSFLRANNTKKAETPAS